MNELSKHIEHLLLRQDCVIVPEFGGFVTHRVHARLDDSDGTMLPPALMVGFNPQLTMNDSVLAQSYVEVYDISHPEANRMIEQEVHDIKKELSSGKTWEIYSVGAIRQNKSGQLLFTPCEAGIVSPEYYGLSGVETARTTKLSLVSSEQAVEGKRPLITISRSFAKRMAVACMVFLMVTLTFMHRDFISTQFIGGIDTTFIENFFNTDKQSVNATIPVTKKTVYIKKTVIIPSTKENTELTHSDEDIWTVVLASRVPLKNAQNFVNKLHEKGIEDARIIGEGKSRKVVTGSFTTKEDANKYKRTLSSNDEFTHAWVLSLR